MLEPPRAPSATNSQDLCLSWTAQHREGERKGGRERERKGRQGEELSPPPKKEEKWRKGMERKRNKRERPREGGLKDERTVKRQRGVREREREAGGTPYLSMVSGREAL